MHTDLRECSRLKSAKTKKRKRRGGGEARRQISLVEKMRVGFGVVKAGYDRVDVMLKGALSKYCVAA